MDENETIASRAVGFLDIVSRFVVLNLAWLLSIFPFAAVLYLILRYGFGLQQFTWILAFIPVLIALPATGGLFYATNQLAHGRYGNLTIYWEGIKKYFWSSYKWGLLNFAVLFIFSVNIWFYGNLALEFAPYLRIAFIVAAAFWAALQIFTFPFMIEQDEPSIKTALRNSLICSARYPLRSFGYLGLIVVIAGVSTYLFIPFWVIISFSLIAYLSNKNTITVIEKMLLDEQKSKRNHEIEDLGESE